MERAEALKRRKEIYETKHPETKWGGAPGKFGGDKKPIPKDAKIAPFAEDTAKKMGVSQSTIQKDIQITGNGNNSLFRIFGLDS